MPSYDIALYMYLNFNKTYVTLNALLFLLLLNCMLILGQYTNIKYLRKFPYANIKFCCVRNTITEKKVILLNLHYSKMILI